MNTLLMKLTEPGKLPYVKLWHDTNLYTFVIDTGSTLSWTTSEVAGKLLLEKECYKKSGAIHATLRTEALGSTEDDNTVPKFSVKLRCGEGSDKITEMNRHVEEPIHGILGADFLRSNGAKIDMDRMLLRI